MGQGLRSTTNLKRLGGIGKQTSLKMSANLVAPVKEEVGKGGGSAKGVADWKQEFEIKHSYEILKEEADLETDFQSLF